MPAVQEAATVLDREFSEDLADLGFETKRKDVGPGQSSRFLGLIFDTRTMSFRVEIRGIGAIKFGERCADVLRASTVTPCDMARLVGVLNWWSCVLYGAKWMSRSLEAMSATCVAKEQWDTAMHPTPAAREELVFWRDNAATIVPFGMPIPNFSRCYTCGSGGRNQRADNAHSIGWSPMVALAHWWPGRSTALLSRGLRGYPLEWVQEGWCVHQA